MATVVERINNKIKPKTFSDCFEERTWKYFEDNLTQSLDIPLRQFFIDHSLQKHCSPTYSSIRNYLQTNGVDITIKDIKKVFIANGYKTQRISRNIISVIVEDSEHRFSGIKYLHDIIQLRNNKLQKKPLKVMFIKILKQLLS